MAVFIIDAQLPPGLATHLRRAGHSAFHVNGVGLGGASDAEIWKWAAKRDAIIVSKDEDYAILSNLHPETCRVLWIQLGNTTNRALWTSLETVLVDIVSGFDHGEWLIELG